MKTNLALSVLLVALLLGGLLASMPRAGAEDSTAEALALIAKGKAALEEGRPQDAIGHLQKAIAVIQAATAEGLVRFLKAAPAGWKADEPKIDKGSWGGDADAVQWISVSRTYRRESDGLVARVTISTSPQLVKSHRAAFELYSDPTMREIMARNKSLEVEPVKEHGWSGVRVITKGKDAKTIAFRESAMAMVTLQKDDADLLGQFWGLLDLKGIAAAVE